MRGPRQFAFVRMPSWSSTITSPNPFVIQYSDAASAAKSPSVCCVACCVACSFVRSYSSWVSMKLWSDVAR